MASDVGLTAPESLAELSVTFRRAVIGLGCAAAGAGVQLGAFSPFITALGISLGVMGVIIAGSAVARRPTESRILGIAALTAFAAIFSAHESWASVRMMFGVLTAVGTVAALLFLLSRTARQIAVSVLIVFHFCGIVTAITSPPATPWMTTQLWVRLFRPHLEFCYTNNAYQFYSPEPGPANLLWFCILGDDNQTRWIKVPNETEVYDPLGVEYYRRLSITERANSNEQFPAGPPLEALARRSEARTWIPMHPEAVPGLQFRMPDENARQFIASYARHVASAFGSGREGVSIKSIKVYLAQHRLLNQKQYAAKRNPYAKDSYLPFFVGEFDAQGHLLNPFDPLLYWIVPIVAVPKQDPVTHATIPGEFDYVNYVIAHAGSDPFDSTVTAPVKEQPHD